MVNYTETSIKITREGIKTGRHSIGFFPSEVSNVEEFLLDRVGTETLEAFLKYFWDEIKNPDPSRLLMLGFDGSGHEFYVEYGKCIASYDAGQKVEFTYHSIPDEQYDFVSGYLQRILRPEVFRALFDPRECSYVWLKNSPGHRFVYLFKHKEGVLVSDIRNSLEDAARTITSEEVHLDDSNKVVIIGIAVTSAGETQLAIYFRPSSISGPSSGG